MVDRDTHLSSSDRSDRLLACLNNLADRPGFFPMVGISPTLDYFLPILPNQLLLMGLSLLQPRKWIGLAMTFVIASAIGAALVTLIVQLAAGEWAKALIADSPNAIQIQSWIELYGLYAVFGLALLPVPPRTAVILCAISGLSALAIALAVLSGRLLPVTLMAFLSAHSPHYLEKIPLLGKRLTPFFAKLRQSTL